MGTASFMNRKKDSPTRNLLLALSLPLLVYGCNLPYFERNTRVTIVERKNPPTFSLKGSGHLNFFWVSEVNAPGPIPEGARAIKGKDQIIWEIWPSNSPSTSIDSLPTIAYGKVPAGFRQELPSSGEPPPLVEGKIYEAGGPSSGADMEVFRFTIQNGNVVELALPSDRYK
jgi:hypothetical protein